MVHRNKSEVRKQIQLNSLILDGPRKNELIVSRVFFSRSDGVMLSVRIKFSNQNIFKMKKTILLIILGFAFYSCQNIDKKQDLSQIVEKDVLKFTDIIGDTLRYDVGEPVFDIVISSDSTLYWKSLNPKYGTEANEKIVVIPISEHENMVSYVENEGKGPGVCWYNDFERGLATVSVFVGEGMMTFSGTVERKNKKE